MKQLSPKRNRPLSSYFETPSNELDSYLQIQQRKFEQMHPFAAHSFSAQSNSQLPAQLASRSTSEPLNAAPAQTPHHTDESDSDCSFESPISKRFSFRPLSKMVSLSKKFTKSTKRLIMREDDEANSTASTIIDSEDDDATRADDEDSDDEKHDTNDTNNTSVYTKNFLQDLNKENPDLEGDELEGALGDVLDANSFYQTTDSDNHAFKTASPTIYKTTSPTHAFKNASQTLFKTALDVKPPNPLKEPLRRFHSMYQTSKEKDIILQDNSILHKSKIKYFKVENDVIPRIDESELNNLLNHNIVHGFDDIIIIDCRFDYEYQGGHIKNAINISNKQELEDRFINNSSGTKKLLIFHCEFSIFRGPTMAQHLRKCDRILNLHNYPNLTYPDVLILQGGYKAYFEKFRTECHPQNYVEMNKKSPELHKYKSLAKLNNYNHLRSSSFTTITSHSENLKILKRQRSITLSLNRASTSISGGLFTGSSPNISTTNNTNSTTNGSTGISNGTMSNSSSYGTINGATNGSNGINYGEFTPPILNFGTGSSNSINSLSNSVNSSNSINSLSNSVSLSELSTFSSNESSDSVSISNSPVMEINDFFSNNSSNSTLNFSVPKKSKKYKFPNSPRPKIKTSGSVQNTILTIPHTANQALGFHHSHGSISHGRGFSLSQSSPVISSPLSNLTPIPTPMSNVTVDSLLDPINDSALEFQ